MTLVRHSVHMVPLFLRCDIRSLVLSSLKPFYHDVFSLFFYIGPFHLKLNGISSFLVIYKRYLVLYVSRIVFDMCAIDGLNMFCKFMFCFFS